MKNEKFECIEQLFDEEYCYDWKQLMLSFESYLGRQAVVDALEYITRVEGWRFQVNESGEIFDPEKEDSE